MKKKTAIVQLESVLKRRQILLSDFVQKFESYSLLCEYCNERNLIPIEQTAFNKCIKLNVKEENTPADSSIDNKVNAVVDFTENTEIEIPKKARKSKKEKESLVLSDIDQGISVRID